jgi:hypothetical protein
MTEPEVAKLREALDTEVMTSMEHLREELVRTRTEAAEVEKSAKLAQVKLARIYRRLATLAPS